MSDHYGSLLPQLQALRPWQLTALGAACCEKIRPVVRFLGATATWNLAKASLDFLWAATLEPEPKVEDAVRLRLQLESLPEWTCETPDSLAFAVGNALNVFLLALDTVGPGPIAEKTKNVGFPEVHDFASTVDEALETYPSLDPLGQRILPAEAASRATLLTQVQRQAAPSPQLNDELRQEARKLAGLVEKALPAYVYDCVRCVTSAVREPY